jgi:hypothetical protein
VATVQGYAALDQYLMGFRAPEEVAPTFVVLNSGVDSGRSPQTGIGFNGQRLDVPIENVVQTMGRRTPDSTVAQRRFRFAFVLVIPKGLSPATRPSRRWTDIAVNSKPRSGATQRIARRRTPR